jgi:excisionase family DNA binding protein
MMMTKETPRPGWRDRMTITVPEYAQIVGVGRNTAYESVRSGEVASIRVRGRVLVCVAPLLRKLGVGVAPSSN